jgi:tRNA 2-thiocytidine biosynthesis protein TtcA
MSKALQNVVPSHLADSSQFDFVGLKTQNMPFENGDIGFDPPEITSQVTPNTILAAPLVITNI